MTPSIVSAVDLMQWTWAVPAPRTGASWLLRITHQQFTIMPVSNPDQDIDDIKENYSKGVPRRSAWITLYYCWAREQ